MLRKFPFLIFALSALLVVTPVNGSAASQICEGRWHDEDRARDVPVRIRLPGGEEQVPVILFSHGLGGSLDAGTIWASAWVEAGFAVIHLQHPGSDTAAWRAGRLREAMNAEQFLARVLDVRFAIDELGRRERDGECDLSRIDRNRIGMAGHSFGAHTTMAVSGQRFPGGVSLTDTRVDAAIAFSPAPAAGSDQSRDAEAYGRIFIPFFSITGTRDEVSVNPIDAADRQRPFRAMPPGEKYLLVFESGEHFHFSGNNRSRRRRIPSDLVGDVARATSLFWRATLNGDEEARAALISLNDILESDASFEMR